MPRLQANQLEASVSPDERADGPYMSSEHIVLTAQSRLLPSMPKLFGLPGHQPERTARPWQRMLASADLSCARHSNCSSTLSSGSDSAAPCSADVAECAKRDNLTQSSNNVTLSCSGGSHEPAMTITKAQHHPAVDRCSVQNNKNNFRVPPLC